RRVKKWSHPKRWLPQCCTRYQRRRKQQLRRYGSVLLEECFSFLAVPPRGYAVGLFVAQTLLSVPYVLIDYFRAQARVPLAHNSSLVSKIVVVVSMSSGINNPQTRTHSSLWVRAGSATPRR